MRKKRERDISFKDAVSCQIYTVLMMHEYNMGRSPDEMILKQDIEVVGESPAALPPTQYQSHMD